MAPILPLVFGPMLIGVILNATLYGVLLVQMLIYWQSHTRDSRSLRALIILLFVAETVNTALDVHMVYQPLITQGGTDKAFTFFPIMLAADPILSAIIATPIQIFVGWRIKVISRTPALTGIIWLFALISFGGAAWLTWTITQIRQFARKPELHWPALVWLLSSALVDVTITISLVVHLSRRKTGFSGTDNAINKIIRLTIQTGMLTAIFATLDVVCFLLLPHTTINFVWDFALSKLYTNALMSTLNTRSTFGRIARTDSRMMRVKVDTHCTTGDTSGFVHVDEHGTPGLAFVEDDDNLLFGSARGKKQSQRIPQRIVPPVAPVYTVEMETFESSPGTASSHRQLELPGGPGTGADVDLERGSVRSLTSSCHLAGVGGSVRVARPTLVPATVEGQDASVGIGEERGGLSPERVFPIQ